MFLILFFWVSGSLMAWLVDKKNNFFDFIYQTFIKLKIQMMDRITRTYGI